MRAAQKASEARIVRTSGHAGSPRGDHVYGEPCREGEHPGLGDGPRVDVKLRRVDRADDRRKEIITRILAAKRRYLSKRTEWLQPLTGAHARRAQKAGRTMCRSETDRLRLRSPGRYPPAPRAYVMSKRRSRISAVARASARRTEKILRPTREEPPKPGLA